MSGAILEGRPGSAARLLAGASVAAVLVGALLVSLLGGSDEVEPDATTTTLDRSTFEPSTTVAVDASHQSTTTTTLSIRVEDVRAAGAAALAGWGRFAISGDLTELDGHFHPDSPQYPLLVEKAAELAADPLDEPPYEFVMFNPITELTSSGLATMRGSVKASRGDDPSSETDWQLSLVWSELVRSWLVWTLEEVS